MTDHDEMSGGYSRAEWTSLSIQDRIRAMNDSIPDPKTINKIDSLSNPSLHETDDLSFSAPEEKEPIKEKAPEDAPKRSSVVDMWRKREGTNPTNGGAAVVVTAAPKTKSPPAWKTKATTVNTAAQETTEQEPTPKRSSVADIWNQRKEETTTSAWKKDVVSPKDASEKGSIVSPRAEAASFWSNQTKSPPQETEQVSPPNKRGTVTDIWKQRNNSPEQEESKLQDSSPPKKSSVANIWKQQSPEPQEPETLESPPKRSSVADIWKQRQQVDTTPEESSQPSWVKKQTSPKTADTVQQQDTSEEPSQPPWVNKQTPPKPVSTTDTAQQQQQDESPPKRSSVANFWTHRQQASTATSPREHPASSSPKVSTWKKPSPVVESPPPQEEEEVTSTSPKRSNVADIWQKRQQVASPEDGPSWKKPPLRKPPPPPPPPPNVADLFKDGKKSGGLSKPVPTEDTDLIIEAGSGSFSDVEVPNHSSSVADIWRKRQVEWPTGDEEEEEEQAADPSPKKSVVDLWTKRAASKDSAASAPPPKASWKTEPKTSSPAGSWSTPSPSNPVPSWKKPQSTCALPPPKKPVTPSWVKQDVAEDSADEAQDHASTTSSPAKLGENTRGGDVVPSWRKRQTVTPLMPPQKEPAPAPWIKQEETERTETDGPSPPRTTSSVRDMWKKRESHASTPTDNIKSPSEVSSVNSGSAKTKFENWWELKQREQQAAEGRNADSASDAPMSSPGRLTSPYAAPSRGTPRLGASPLGTLVQKPETRAMSEVSEFTMDARADYPDDEDEPGRIIVSPSKRLGSPEKKKRIQEQRRRMKGLRPDKGDDISELTDTFDSAFSDVGFSKSTSSDNQSVVASGKSLLSTDAKNPTSSVQNSSIPENQEVSGNGGSNSSAKRKKKLNLTDIETEFNEKTDTAKDGKVNDNGATVKSAPARPVNRYQHKKLLASRVEGQSKPKTPKTPMSEAGESDSDFSLFQYDPSPRAQSEAGVERWKSPKSAVSVSSVSALSTRASKVLQNRRRMKASKMNKDEEVMARDLARKVLKKGSSPSVDKQEKQPQEQTFDGEWETFDSGGTWGTKPSGKTAAASERSMLQHSNGTISKPPTVERETTAKTDNTEGKAVSDGSAKELPVTASPVPSPPPATSADQDASFEMPTALSKGPPMERSSLASRYQTSDRFLDAVHNMVDEAKKTFNFVESEKRAYSFGSEGTGSSYHHSDGGSYPETPSIGHVRSDSTDLSMRTPKLRMNEGIVTESFVEESTANMDALQNAVKTTNLQQMAADTLADMSDGVHDSFTAMSRSLKLDTVAKDIQKYLPTTPTAASSTAAGEAQGGSLQPPENPQEEKKLEVPNERDTPTKESSKKSSPKKKSPKKSNSPRKTPKSPEQPLKLPEKLPGSPTEDTDVAIEVEYFEEEQPEEEPQEQRRGSRFTFGRSSSKKTSKTKSKSTKQKGSKGASPFGNADAESPSRRAYV